MGTRAVFMLVVIAVAALAVPVAGGRLAALAGIPIRRVWCLALALAAQVAITSVPGGSRPLHIAGHLVSYALAGVFVVANRRLPGTWLISTGATLNLLAILTNAGVMPADPGALRRAGISTAAGEFTNSAPAAHAPLAFLGDVFAIPGWLPMANVFSVGDVLLLLGGVYGIHRICGSRLLPRVKPGV